MELLIEPMAWLIVLLLSGLGVVGNLALYQMRVKRLYDEHGSLALLLSGIPVLGSLLTTAAGAFDVQLFPFVLFVFIAKLVRNWLIVVVPLEIYRLIVR